MKTDQKKGWVRILIGTGMVAWPFLFTSYAFERNGDAVAMVLVSPTLFLPMIGSFWAGVFVTFWGLVLLIKPKT